MQLVQQIEGLVTTGSGVQNQLAGLGGLLSQHSCRQKETLINTPKYFSKFQNRFINRTLLNTFSYKIDFLQVCGRVAVAKRSNCFIKYNLVAMAFGSIFQYTFSL